MIATFRIEHRAGGTATPLSRDLAQLRPLRVQLEAAGAGGELLVLDEATGRIVVRCPLGVVPEAGDAAQTVPLGAARS